MVDDFSLFSALPFNKKELRPRGIGVSQAQSPPLMGLFQSPREGRHSEIHPFMALES